MKYLNLLLIFNLLFCYVFLGMGISSAASDGMNCHSAGLTETQVVHSGQDSYRGEAQTNETCVCQDALMNAPQNLNLDLKDILQNSIVIKLQESEVEQISNSNLNFEIKKEYSPPDIFLSNSAFLC